MQLQCTAVWLFNAFMSRWTTSSAVACLIRSVCDVFAQRSIYYVFRSITQLETEIAVQSVDIDNVLQSWSESCGRCFQSTTCWSLASSVPSKKILHWTNVEVLMQLRNHADNQWSVSSGKRAMRYSHDIKFGMLQVRENAISLRKWPGGILPSCVPWREHFLPVLAFRICADNFHSTLKI